MRHVSMQTSARKLEAKKEMTTWDVPALLLCFIPDDRADKKKVSFTQRMRSLKLHVAKASYKGAMRLME